MSLAGSTPTIQSALEGAARKKTELSYQQELARQYRYAFQDVSTELSRLGRYIDAQQRLGAPVSPSWLMRQERYLSLQSQLAAAADAYGDDVFDLLEQQREAAARVGLSGAREEALRAGGVPAPLRDLGGFSGAAWAILDKRAFEAAIALTTQRRSPLNALLNSIGPDAVSSFQNAFLKGIATGKNPNRIASEFKRSLQGMTQGRAQLIARTEWHRATRIARSEAFTASTVIKSWIWRAALDRRTCGICYLNHGTEHPTTETLPGHPGCRCVMVPKTKDWSELGLPGVPNTRPPIEPGASSFRRLPRAEQKRLIGKSRLDLFEQGQKLRDMTFTQANPIWGPMQKFKPLAQTPRGGKTGRVPPEDAYKDPFSIKPGEANTYQQNLGYEVYGKGFQASKTHPVVQRVHDWVDQWANGGFTTGIGGQKWALSEYQGAGYRTINSFLRNKGYTGDMDWVRNHIKAIDSAFGRTKLPTAANLERGVSFSGFGVSSAEELAKMVGQTVTEPGFVSTAIGRGFSGKDVSIHITAPKGTDAIWMSRQNTSSSTQFQGVHDAYELEVLLPRGSRFLIEKVEIKGYRAEVWARLIPPPGPSPVP